MKVGQWEGMAYFTGNTLQSWVGISIPGFEEDEEARAAAVAASVVAAA